MRKLFFLLFFVVCILFVGIRFSSAIQRETFDTTRDENIPKEENFLKNYEMTDKKHKKFLKESEDYALADTMLNFTWYAMKDYYDTVSNGQLESQLAYYKDKYKKILEEQRIWLETGRNAVASSFSIHLSEVDAFTLAIVARTQELAAFLYKKPQLGSYLYTAANNLKNPKVSLIQGGHILINSLPENDFNEKIIISGQSYSKSGDICEIYGENIVQSINYSQILHGNDLVELENKTINHKDPLQEGLDDDFYASERSSVQGKNQEDFSANHILGIEHPQGWLSFYEKLGTKAIFFALFTENAMYIVHSDGCSECGKNVSFQGMYRFSGHKR